MRAAVLLGTAVMLLALASEPAEARAGRANKRAKGKQQQQQQQQQQQRPPPQGYAAAMGVAMSAGSAFKKAG